MSVELTLRRRLVARLVESAGNMAQAEYELGVAAHFSTPIREKRNKAANRAAARFYRVAQAVVRDSRRQHSNYGDKNGR